jgi:hypothetical protein
MPTDAEILEEIELHSDNGVPSYALPKLVSEILEVPQKRVKHLMVKWWKGEVAA